jgi:hypothetical protein
MPKRGGKTYLTRRKPWQPRVRELRRQPNAKLRTREYLTPDEVEVLLKAVRNNRHATVTAP